MRDTLEARIIEGLLTMEIDQANDFACQSNWTYSLSVGVPVLDDQHKLMYELLGNEELFKNPLTNNAISILKNLRDCAKTHFKCEESYMGEHFFPERKSHKIAHRILELKIKKLLRDRLTISPSDIEKVSVELKEHICREDMRYAKHVLKSLNPEPANRDKVIFHCVDPSMAAEVKRREIADTATSLKSLITDLPMREIKNLRITIRTTSNNMQALVKQVIDKKYKRLASIHRHFISPRRFWWIVVFLVFSILTASAIYYIYRTTHGNQLLYFMKKLIRSQ